MVEAWNLDLTDNPTGSARFPEGQDAGTVNNGSRALEGALARAWDALYPKTLTAGGPTAYTATIGQDISGGYQDRMIVGLQLNVPNGDNATLAINGQAAAPFYNQSTNPAVAGQLPTYGWYSYLASGPAWMLMSVPPVLEAAFRKVGAVVGELVEVVDVGGNPGLPVLDGSQLTNLPITITRPPRGSLLRGMLGPAASHPDNTNGWWIDNVGTIGNAASGATYANANAENLYKHLWVNVADTQAPVVGGRGVSADADWTANKPLTLPDYRGKPAVQTGGVAAGVIGAKVPNQANADVRGGVFGAGEHTLTLAEAPPHNHVPTRAGRDGTLGNGYDQANNNFPGEIAADSLSTEGGGESHNNVQTCITEDVWIAL